jgi:hypothetical protein
LRPKNIVDVDGVWRSMKVGFLFNHDAGHQSAHLVPILNAYAATWPNVDIYAYVGGAALKESVLAGLSAPNVEIAELSLPPALGATARILDIAMPASRWTRLTYNADKFRHLDALVAPERTSLTLREPLRRHNVKFIYSGHGAGDRAIGFHPSFSRFDLLLLPGEKYARRLRESGGLSDNECALIGYPKFDFARTSRKERFFDNDNPTVVYNPHFSPEFSSWFAAGVRVLEWFAANPDLNLIVAPHVMLFRRRLHVSTDTGRTAWRRQIPAEFRQRPNILIDTDSPRLFDMSYMVASDLYLGDISSQVMEFVVNPRPCVFLNTNRHDWRGDENFAAWRLGPVIDRLDDLGPAIRNALADPGRYRNFQVAHFADSFDLTEETSSLRAVNAIGDFLDRKCAQRQKLRAPHSGAPFAESLAPARLARPEELEMQRSAERRLRG